MPSGGRGAMCITGPMQGSMRSSSPPRAAARRSRIMASCCALTRSMRQGRRSSAPRPRTSPSSSPASSCPRLRRPCASPIIRPVPCSMASRSGRKAQTLLAQCGLHGSGYSGRPSLLRLGRHLQHPAARDRHAAPGPENKKYRDNQSAGDRHRQYRLHHPARNGLETPILHTVELLDWAYGGPEARQTETSHWRGLRYGQNASRRHASRKNAAGIPLHSDARGPRLPRGAAPQV